MSHPDHQHPVHSDHSTSHHHPPTATNRISVFTRGDRNPDIIDNEKTAGEHHLDGTKEKHPSATTTPASRSTTSATS